MSKSIILILFLVLLFGLTIQAQTDENQSGQVDELAERLKRYSNELFESSYSEISNNTNNSKKDLERVFQTQQFEASVELFQQMLGDQRQTSELVDAVGLLKDLADDLPKSSSNSSLLENVEKTVKEIEENLKNRKTVATPTIKKEPANENAENINRPIIGRAFWRGMVDNKVHLLVKGRKITTRTMEGRALEDGSFTFTQILPNDAVIVGVKKQEGRGKVSIFQQPSSENDFTAIIEVEDPGGGAKEYRLEIFWK